MGIMSSRYVHWLTRDVRKTEDLLASVRGLAKHSTLFDIGVAAAVLRLAEHQSTAGQWEEALAGLEEIVTLHGRSRRLGFRRREWTSVLARACVVRSLVLRELGRADDELRAAEEAVQRYRTLIELDARRFATSYVGALANLTFSYGNAERYEDAVRTGEDAAWAGRALRALGADCEDMTLLAVLSAYLHELDRLEEGARYAEDAVDLWRRRRAAGSHVDERRYAQALMNLGVCLIPTRPEGGLQVIDEAIGLLEELLDREPGQHEDMLERVRHNRVHLLERLGRPREEVLGPYPPCDRCRAPSRGPVGTRHRQVHVAANGREACVDEGLADLMPKLWAVCDTVNSCEHAADVIPGAMAKAYVIPAPGHAEAAERVLVELGFDVQHDDHSLMFRLQPHEPVQGSAGLD